MASLLRQIVAGPRSRHPEAGLDLCYVTDNIIATSGPSGTYPQLAYRNPLKQLVKFLDDKHGDQWAIWEFRGEGTGYPDSEVYNRIYHYPWPDHHPPPFALIPLIMGSMRNWLKGAAPKEKNDEIPQINIMNGSVDEDQDELRKRLEAIQLAQRDATTMSPTSDTFSIHSGNSPNPGPIDGENSHDARASQDRSLDLPIPDDHSAISSQDASGTSTPNSTKRKKEVRWRESTLLPPKELRQAESNKDLKQASESHPAKAGKFFRRNSDKGDKHPKAVKSSEDLKAVAAGTNGAETIDTSKRVVVVHCKAGKGRSGTVSCSYLISEEGWTAQAALQRFTERRMRPGFGAGVSIPSQLRWISYVDRWTKNGKRYLERPVEITEVHVWGLRDRVKVSIEGFKEEGRKIEVLHSFTKEEKVVVREGGVQKAPGFAGVVTDVVAQEKAKHEKSGTNGSEAGERVEEEVQRGNKTVESLEQDGGGGDVVFRPTKALRLESADVNVDFERRNKGVSNLTMVTSVAHVWFNAFFEGQGPEKGGVPEDSGVFEIEWDRMDGIKGSSRKGTRAFDKVAVVWRFAPDVKGREVRVLGFEEGIKDAKPADWTGKEQATSGEERDRDIGEQVDSSDTSRSASVGA